MDRKKRAHLICTGLLLGSFAFAIMGFALKADENAADPARALLQPLLTKAKLPATWDAKAGAFRIPFEGPDAWVTVADDYVWVRSYLGEVPAGKPQALYQRLLSENYELYRGKYSVDADQGVWFELATPKRLVDADELLSEVACVSTAADYGAKVLRGEAEDGSHAAQPENAKAPPPPPAEPAPGAG